MTTPPPETTEARLDGVRCLARALLDSSDSEVWSLAVAIDQLCKGQITVAQALAQVDN